MAYVLSNAWALLAGMFLLMVGNGLQTTLLAVRGDLEGFSASTLSMVMSGYFLGFLLGSRISPWLIKRVGHVRVFAALASFISAVFILYAAIPDPVAWIILRIIVGFCFSGVYVAAESWLNGLATNENRGQALSAYLIVQMLGIIAAQAFLNVADPSGYVLFVLISVLVSISFAPILLSVSAVPAYDTGDNMPLRKLWRRSPLGCVGMFVLGGVFAVQFGMAGVYATQIGLTLGETSMFVAIIYVGGMLFQFPLGLLSDRMDRRILVTILTAFGGVAMGIGAIFSGGFWFLMLLGLLLGGVANPLYSLLIAYTNDYLAHEEMAAASGGLIFLTGLGAILGPLVVGTLMTNIGPSMFFAFISTLFLIIAFYAGYRMTQRATPEVEDQGEFSAVSMQASPVAFGVAQDIAIEQAIEQEEGED